jgi:hypothetical protein
MLSNWGDHVHSATILYSDRSFPFILLTRYEFAAETNSSESKLEVFALQSISLPLCFIIPIHSTLSVRYTLLNPYTSPQEIHHLCTKDKWSGYCLDNEQHPGWRGHIASLEDREGCKLQQGTCQKVVYTPIPQHKPVVE